MISSKKQNKKEKETDSVPIHSQQQVKPETRKPQQKTKKQQQSEQKKRNPAQSKYPTLFCGHMQPDPSISGHPAFPVLLKYAMEGCPVDCGVPWT